MSNYYSVNALSNLTYTKKKPAALWTPHFQCDSYIGFGYFQSDAVLLLHALICYPTITLTQHQFCNQCLSATPFPWIAE